mmetsp:Transcript_27345/g.40371  ORF Transcript_27345/g.40371 Transcript_27345/m.40371 type:complete len:476 (-) Transcript_27345:45-1472(-)
MERMQEVNDETNRRAAWLCKATTNYTNATPIKKIESIRRVQACLQEIVCGKDMNRVSVRVRVKQDLCKLIKVLFRRPSSSHHNNSPFACACLAGKTDLVNYYFSLYILSTKRQWWCDYEGSLTYPEWIASIGSIESLTEHDFLVLKEKVGLKVRNVLTKKISMTDALNFIQSFLIDRANGQCVINGKNNEYYSNRFFYQLTIGSSKKPSSKKTTKRNKKLKESWKKTPKRNKKPILNSPDFGLADAKFADDYAKFVDEYDDCPNLKNYFNRDDYYNDYIDYEMQHYNLNEREKDEINSIDDIKERGAINFTDANIEGEELLETNDDVFSYKFVDGGDSRLVVDEWESLSDSDAPWAMIDTSAEDFTSQVGEDDWDEVSDIQSVVSVNTFAEGKPNFSYKDALSLNKKENKPQVAPVKLKDDDRRHTADRTKMPSIVEDTKEEHGSQTLLHDQYFDYDCAKQKGGQRRRQNRLKGC